MRSRRSYVAFISIQTTNDNFASMSPWQQDTYASHSNSESTFANRFAFTEINILLSYASKPILICDATFSGNNWQKRNSSATAKTEKWDFPRLHAATETMIFVCRISKCPVKFIFALHEQLDSICVASITSIAFEWAICTDTRRNARTQTYTHKFIYVLFHFIYFCTRRLRFKRKRLYLLFGLFAKKVSSFWCSRTRVEL